LKITDVFAREQGLAFNMGLSALSFLAYVLTFKLTASLPDIFKYAGWIYLVFLPAGTKLVCIMLFGIWGTIGDALALYWMATQFLPDGSPGLWAIFSVTSSFMTFVAIRFAMRTFAIRPDLGNLQFWQLPFLSLIGAGIHGFITILVMVKIGLIHHAEYWSSSFAIITGDFVGIFLVLVAFSLLTKGFVARPQHSD
jgi:hypothetical protein